MTGDNRRKVPHHMTVDEFIAWVGDGRWQLVDCEPRAMAPANATHGIIQANVAYTLTRHLRDAGSPCRAVTEPAIVPRVRARSNMRVPDVAVTCSQINAGQLALPEPLLVVEILSPTNETETWENVWTYVSIPSVQEILVLRSASIAADVLRRRTDGTWPEEPIQIGRDETLRLECIDPTCPLGEFHIGTCLARSS
jgi:Uma2 family endonuclease